MKTLKCKDMDPASTCEFMATGNDNTEVMASMKAHVMADHADVVAGKSDEEMNAMMMPHIKEEAMDETAVEEEAPAM